MAFTGNQVHAMFGPGMTTGSVLAGPVGGALIGAGGSLLGGLMGQHSASDDAKHAAQDAVRFAKNSIRWRVKDAERAGIHPLYALGAAQASAPQFIPGQSHMGSAVKDAAAQIGTIVAQKENLKAQTDLLKAQTAESLARARAVSTPTPPQVTAQSFGADGPYDPYAMDKKPALVPVVQPSGEVDLIGNQDAGIENPEFLAAWYMFKNWAHEKGKSFRNMLGRDLSAFYDSTRGQTRESILSGLIHLLGGD